MKYLLSRDELRQVTIDGGRGTTYRFDGGAHGLASFSYIAGEYQPGCATRRHRHGYEELFIVHEGCGAYTVGETTVEARAGDTVLVPADAWHAFRNVGEGVLRHTAIHGAGAMTGEFAPEERRGGGRDVERGEQGGRAALHRGVVERGG